ncbi:MAG: low specificity L-threonine aldolase [Proteobacteria bacterium]|nr:low specificity L-threonine aldolase [Pseudomonadota bacterium]
MNFCSDNTTGAAPEIMAALAEANAGQTMPYGEDALTKRLTARFGEVFETDVAVFPVTTGTAANALSLALMAPPFGVVFCHREAHIAVNECGAPEFYTGGAKLKLLDGSDGKIEAETLAAALAGAGAGDVHHVQPAALSLSQQTEAGTVYGTDEVGALCEVAHGHGLGVHMDGARFANAVAHLGCAPAEVTWRAGVDVLAFGATKNGALAAEAVVVFKPELARDLGYRRKRAGHLLSKMRFVSAQLEAYLAAGLWLKNATHANRLAATLARGLAAVPGAEVIHPVHGNEVFVRLPEPVIAGLLADGFAFYRRGGENATTLRLVTAFNTRAEDVRAIVDAARRHGRSAAQ